MTTIIPPLIGITLESNLLTFNEEYSCQTYGFPKNCSSILTEAGGIAMGIPPMNKKNLQAVLPKLDGIILYRHSIHPELFTSSINTETPTLFEFQLLKTAWEHDIPVLGIAGGAHYITLFLGGTLHNTYEEATTYPLPHEQFLPPHQGSHSITLQPNSLLFSLTSRQNWLVNSFHTQSIKSTGKGIISAQAEDGIIEAIEDPSRVFFLGVQWHPEFAVDYTDRKIFSAFISKAKSYAKNRS